MSINILDAVKKQLSPDLIAKASTFLGESDNAVSKALSGILPTILGGLVSKSNAGNAGAEEVLSMAKETHHSGFLGNIGSMLGDGGSLLNKGASLLKSIFGSKSEGIIDTIAGYAGIRKSSASSLMSMVAPVALGTLGKHATETNLNASGLSSLLNSQKGSIMNILPGGLSSLAGMIGLDGISDTISRVTGGNKRTLSATTDYEVEKARKGGNMKWLLPLLAIGLILGAIIYFSKSCKNATDDKVVVNDTTVIVDPATLNVPNTNGLPSLSLDTISGLINYDLGKEVEFSLPDGVKFMAAESGFESQLLNFIQSGNIDTVDKSANWYNMFDVQFKSGGNEYNGKAEAQLANCAAILKAYPAVIIKLGGYTDNTGSAAANKKVSQLRADKVKADLIKMGVAAKQIVESVGYGPEFPICEANDTQECQARNRRVACKVAVK